MRNSLTSKYTYDTLIFSKKIGVLCKKIPHHVCKQFEVTVLDKYEYRVRAEEINALIEKREYAEAVKIADTIDWRRVKSVTMLCKVSELYKMNRRYEDSKEILLLAYDRQPGSRKIVYSLCELCIKLEELVLAIEYYKEFVQIAPKDTGRFILQYRLYEAQDVSLEERIAVLEEYKKRDYREKWAYELAYLYHRIGLATRCVEECDELILWFGEGKYVIKAMELKMLHVPLTPTQREKYDKRFQSAANAYVVKNNEEEPAVSREEVQEPESEEIKEPVTTDTIPSMPIQIKSVEPSNAPTMRIPSRNVNEELELAEQEEEGETEEQDFDPENISIDMPVIPLAQTPDDLDIHVKTMDMGEYNTINLQRELAKNLAKVMEQEDMEASDATKALPVDSINDYANAGMGSEYGEDEAEEQAAPAPIDTAITKEVVNEVVKALGPAEHSEPITEEDLLNSLREQEAMETLPEEMPPEEDGISQQSDGEQFEAQETTAYETSSYETAGYEAPVAVEEPVTAAEPEEEMVDEQITGQLSFDDIMAEWEETRKANEAKHLEEMRQKVLKQTGPMFKDFDAAAKASVQADLDLIAPSLNVFHEQEPEEPIINNAGYLRNDEEESGQSEASSVEYEEIPEEPEMPAEVYAEPVQEEEPAAEHERPSVEPVTHPTLFNTAEIYGLEEKLLSSLAEQEEAADDGVEELEEIQDVSAYAEPEEETAFVPDREPEEISPYIPLEESERENSYISAEAPKEEYPSISAGIPKEENYSVSAGEPEKEYPPISAGVPKEENSPVFAEALEEESPYISGEASKYADNPVSAGEPMAEEIKEAPPKPGTHTEEFDKSLEKMVMDALAESEKKVENPLKADTGFIITDLSEDTEPQKAEAFGTVPASEEKKRSLPVRRSLTRDEKEMFGSIAQTRQVQEEVANAIDNISLSPCIGNVLVTGEKGTGTLTVAKNLVKVLSVHYDSFSGKVAKITGEILNTKSIEGTLNNLSNGALIVEQAGKLDDMTLLSLGEYLKKKRDGGILVIMEDTKKELDNLLLKANMPRQYFDLRIDIAALDNNGLVNYGKEYANEKEYSIDDMGVLALYTRISDMQTNDHAVTVDEVREIVDEAIRNAERKNISHFMDVLLAKRYDDEDMIVLREKDFLK